MKKLLAIVALAFALTSCSESGTTTQKSINQDLLPTELKGLKIYAVSTGGSYIKVGILPGYRSVSTTYSKGKTTESTIMLVKDGGNQIIFENDSILIIRK